MLETFLFVMLGFLVATVIAFAIAPAIWRRAEILERRRLEASLPMRKEELQAEIDVVRAERAMAVRRLEVRLETMRKKSAEDMIAMDAMRIRMADMDEAFIEREKFISRLEARNSAQANALDNAKEKAALQLGMAQSDEEDAAADDLNTIRVQMVAREMEIDRLNDTIRELRVEKRELERELRTAQNQKSVSAPVSEPDIMPELVVVAPEESEPQITIDDIIRDRIDKIQALALKASRRRSDKARKIDEAELREEVSSVAAIMVAMVAEKEGAGSPIETALQGVLPPPGGKREADQSLGERIRSLQD